MTRRTRITVTTRHRARGKISNSLRSVRKIKLGTRLGSRGSDSPQHEHGRKRSSLSWAQENPDSRENACYILDRSHMGSGREEKQSISSRGGPYRWRVMSAVSTRTSMLSPHSGRSSVSNWALSIPPCPRSPSPLSPSSSLSSSLACLPFRGGVGRASGGTIGFCQAEKQTGQCCSWRQLAGQLEEDESRGDGV